MGARGLESREKTELLRLAWAEFVAKGDETPNPTVCSPCQPPVEEKRANKTDKLVIDCPAYCSFDVPVKLANTAKDK